MSKPFHIYILYNNVFKYKFQLINVENNRKQEFPEILACLSIKKINYRKRSINVPMVYWDFTHLPRIFL